MIILKAATIVLEPTPAQLDQVLTKDSLRQPLWHVVVLTILTCSAYPFYWFYKNWRDLSAQASQLEDGSGSQLARFRNISPLLRTIGLFVPVVNIYLALMQFKGIAALYPAEDSIQCRHPLFVASIALAAFIGLQYLALLKGPLYLLSFSAAIPMAAVQYWLNAYWRSIEDPQLPVRYAFSVKELVAIVIGSLWLGLILASFWIVPANVR